MLNHYPEHWDPSLWEQDARLMADSGVRIVRVGEFAWSRFLSAGLFPFSVRFHRFISADSSRDHSQELS
ncbi:beta-galactosidase [Paenibacillus xylanilyticus]|uniref:beta-galactosidase n=1 Tax=Paenibacillus xylanilyticus TaxID=248903 RepID=UPI0039A3B210